MTKALHVRDLPPGALTAAGQLRLEPQARPRVDSQAKGDEAEDVVQAYHARFDVARLAALEYRPPARVRNARGGWSIIASQGCDFGGALHDAAKTPIEVELKWVRDTRLAFSRLREPQRRVLQLCDRGGGIAVVLCLVGVPLVVATWCAVPARVVLARIDAGAKSLPVRELLGWRVAQGTPRAADKEPPYFLAPWLRDGGARP